MHTYFAHTDNRRLVWSFSKYRCIFWMCCAFCIVSAHTSSLYRDLIHYSAANLQVLSFNSLWIKREGFAHGHRYSMCSQNGLYIFGSENIIQIETNHLRWRVGIDGLEKRIWAKREICTFWLMYSICYFYPDKCWSLDLWLDL